MDDVDATAFNAVGKVGSPACGDELRVWMTVDPTTERIQAFKWKTFGCGSAIASTSMASVMVTENGGMTLEEARRLKPQDIMERLGGLPQRKFHCSVLCDKALRDAINDYYRRTNQFDKMQVEAKRVIDPVSKVTDHDIEEAVLDGANTLELVQQRTKVGIGNPGVFRLWRSLFVRSIKRNILGSLMKIHFGIKVDEDLCIGAASCVTIKPDVFPAKRRE